MIHVKPQKNLTLDEWFVHIMAPKNWNSEERGFEILNATAAIFRFFIWENRLPLLPAWWCPVGWFDFDVFANFYSCGTFPMVQTDDIQSMHNSSISYWA